MPSTTAVFSLCMPQGSSWQSQRPLVDKLPQRPTHTGHNEETQPQSRTAVTFSLQELGHQAAEHHSADNAAVDAQAPS